jgi:ubiquinone/menaquinone biosynthesis C-methylase UbiE
MAFFSFIRKFKDLGITGSFTKWYDKNTRETRLDEMRKYAKEVMKHIKDGANVLEIAPGPGYMSIELAKMGNFNITGIDISPDFVEICKTNAKRENVNVTFLEGNVSEMKFKENTFDFIFCSAAFKNFKKPVTALQEMYRVLKTGGIGLIVDMRRDITRQGLEEEVGKITKPGFERLWVKSTFKNLAKYAYKKDEFIKMIKQTSFAKNEIHESGIGFFVYLYK